MGDLSHMNSVLIVEDDFLIAMDLEVTLGNLGCSGMEKFGSCAGALEHIANTTFDLVTVDVKLQDGDCHDLVKALEDGGIPFVYVSGVDRRDAPPHAAPWVTKPVAQDYLLAAVLEATSEAGQPQKRQHRQV